MTEIIEQTESPEDKVAEMLAAMQKKNEAEAAQQAERVLKKNRTELNRLYAHAQQAAVDNNFPAYEYAIKKSRDILRQPYTDRLIEVQWASTQAAIKGIIDGLSK